MQVLILVIHVVKNLTEGVELSICIDVFLVDLKKAKECISEGVEKR